MLKWVAYVLCMCIHINFCIFAHLSWGEICWNGIAVSEDTAYVLLQAVTIFFLCRIRVELFCISTISVISSGSQRAVLACPPVPIAFLTKNGEGCYWHLVGSPGILLDILWSKRHSCFGPAGSFLLELLVIALHSSPVVYWTPSILGDSSFRVISFCLFILFMGFSRQEYWSGLPFPPLVDHILSELFTMTCPSWVALHSMAHSFIELCRKVNDVYSIKWSQFLCENYFHLHNYVISREKINGYFYYPYLFCLKWEHNSFLILKATILTLWGKEGVTHGPPLSFREFNGLWRQSYWPCLDFSSYR